MKSRWRWIAPLFLASAAALAASVPADEAPGARALDQDVQVLKDEVLDLNRELFLLEEELLFPANTQVAVFVSMDVGDFFELDSVQLTVDDKPVSKYLYTEREVDALFRGGVHRLYLGNLKAGEHELVAVFTGQGPHARDYRRGATLKFEKGIGAEVRRAARSRIARASNSRSSWSRSGSSPVRDRPPRLHRRLRMPPSSAGWRRRRRRGRRRARRHGAVRDLVLRRSPVPVLPGQDYFDALTHLLAARDAERVSHHEAESELLLGGLYLSYGQHVRAEEIFERLLTQSRRRRRCAIAPGSILGKVRYQRGLNDEALGRVRRICRRAAGGARSRAADARGPGADGSTGDFDGAQRVARMAWKRPDGWLAYARYNLGVALVRLNRLERGRARCSTGSGAARRRHPELTSLRDKANLALGYAWLQIVAAGAGQAGPGAGAAATVRSRTRRCSASAGRMRQTPRLPRRAGAVARAGGPRSPGQRRPGVAAGGAVCLCAARRPRLGGERYQRALGRFDGEIAHLDGAIERARARGPAHGAARRRRCRPRRWYWRSAEAAGHHR